MYEEAFVCKYAVQSFCTHHIKDLGVNFGWIHCQSCHSPNPPLPSDRRATPRQGETGPSFTPGYPAKILWRWVGNVYCCCQLHHQLVTDSNRVLKWWRHKNDFSEIMGFIQLFGTTYLKKVHTRNIGKILAVFAMRCFRIRGWWMIIV